ncbi:MAG: alpha-amylase [Bacteroidetes bacterium GWE2_42_24]|nr:MAG: alpha-amylase [Bacteroidetes bacterium GWE2_42_24]
MYFQVHQPYRLRTYRFFDIGADHHYYDDYQNRYLIRRIAEKCYLPANNLLLDLINKHNRKFKVSFSISGVALQQFIEYAPEVITSFQKLAATGNVEFLAETYAHSLVALKSKTEFIRQIKMQVDLINELFGQKPTAFRNTELVYSDEIGEMVNELGFKVMLAEGAKHILGWKSPNFLYNNSYQPNLKVLLRNFRLSDDIAFRFSEQSWSEWPLTAEKYVDWINAVDPKQPVVNLFMDYETFGEHQWKETGIFDFLNDLPGKAFTNSDIIFRTPSELSDLLESVGSIHVPFPASWADEERDLTAWLGNELQDEAFDTLYNLTQKVRQVQDPSIKRDWLFLQSSDHFYYMCTKWFSDGEVHKYFNPYNTPYEAFINYMNVLSDFSIRVDNWLAENPDSPEETIGKAYVNIANSIKKEAKSVENELKKKMAGKINDFNNLLEMSDKELKKVIKDIDADQIAAAIKDLGEEVEERFKKLASPKNRARLEELKNDAVDFTKKKVTEGRKAIFEQWKSFSK